MKRNDILKCAICGLTAEVLDIGGGNPPICCDKPMQPMPEQTAEFKFEKHVPYPEELPGGRTRVVVGKDAAHPMLEAHHIEWIEVRDGADVFRRYLASGDAPEAEFPIQFKKGLVIREFCNMHGLWVYEVK
ncbi:MAG: hypothetical protein MJ025_05790 [Victivallaceae bacterium]|nr:hypothetical protein [Victivallaceae bacterium]